MNREPLVSVIVPVYNVDKYLAQCIDSLIIQTYQSLEIILVDDGSTDESGSVCDAYAKKDSRIQVIHKENGGVSVARNSGILEARGSYICFVDADDVVKPDYILYLYKLLKRYKADISACNYIKISSEEKEKIKNKRIKKRTKVFTSIEAIKSMLYKKEITGYSYLKLIKKELIEGELFNTQLKLVEDFDFMFRVIKKAKRVVYGNKILYLYYQNSGSCMHDSNWKKYEAAWKFLKNMMYVIEEEIPSLQTAYITYLFVGGLGFYSKSVYWSKAEKFKACLRNDIKQYSAIVADNKEAKMIYRILGEICRINERIGCELCRMSIYMNIKLKIQLRRAV